MACRLRCPWQGKIVAQGRLLLQDTFLVSEPGGGNVKERRVFLFEQLVIFSEPLDKKKGFSLPGFLYKNSIKVRESPFGGLRVDTQTSESCSNLVSPRLQVSCLSLEENVEGDANKFLLSSCSTSGTMESYVLHSSHPGVREVWTLQISQILDSQHNFLNGRSKVFSNLP